MTGFIFSVYDEIEGHSGQAAGSHGHHRLFIFTGVMESYQRRLQDSNLYNIDVQQSHTQLKAIRSIPSQEGEVNATSVESHNNLRIARIMR